MPEQTDAPPLLPETLDAAGYDTYSGAAFITPHLALQGWYQTHRVYGDARAETVLQDYVDWRAGRDRTLGYLHLGDLHAPIEPPAEYTDKLDVDLSLPGIRHIRKYGTDFDSDDSDCRYYREQKLLLYQAALNYISDQLSPILKRYRDDTSVFMVGDHGEAFWEHQELDRQITDSRPNYCFGHGGTPFDVVARVPVATINAPLPDGGWASLRDIPNTILSMTVDEAEVPGHNWAEPIPDDRAVICEATRYGVERKAVYSDGWKVIRSYDDDVTLVAAVDETGEDFECEPPEGVVSELLQEMPAVWTDGRVTTGTSDFTKGQLEALGYR